MGKHPSILTRVPLLLSLNLKITPVEQRYAYKHKVRNLLTQTGAEQDWNAALKGNFLRYSLKGEYKWHIHAKIAALSLMIPVIFVTRPQKKFPALSAGRTTSASTMSAKAN